MINRKMVIVGIAVVILGVGIFFFVRHWRGRADRGSTAATSTPGTTTAVAVPPGPDRFPDDQDRDGIPDAKEKELGTSPVQFDTDGDNLSDQVEIEVLHTDSTKRDTDGDGYSDGWEVLGGYNPNGPGKLVTSTPR